MQEHHIEHLMQQFSAICQEKGLKLTHQRLVLYKELMRMEGHPSAEDLYNQVKPILPTVSLDTVYRTLMMFENYDLVEKINGVDNKARYDTNLIPHHHFICTKCNKIEDIEWLSFDSMPLPDDIHSKGIIEKKSVEIRGICTSCLNPSTVSANQK